MALLKLSTDDDDNDMRYDSFCRHRRTKAETAKEYSGYKKKKKSQKESGCLKESHQQMTLR